MFGFMFQGWRFRKPAQISKEVIASINDHPEDWRPISEKTNFGEWCRGIENTKLGIKVTGLGNSCAHSVCRIHAKIEETGEYSEIRNIGSKGYLEQAAIRWFETAPLEAIVKSI